MNRLVALGAASAAALVGAARTVDPAPTDLAVTLAAPATAEAGEIVPLTVAVANGGPGSAEQPRVILALGDLRYRPREASPALHCAGVTTVARGDHITCTLVVPPNTHDKFLIGGLFARARGDFTAKLTFWRRIR